MTALVLVPFAVANGASAADVAGSALVYGGLVGLAAGFVYVDRVQARQCPRCGARNARRTQVCDRCGYDLVERPTFACSEGHVVTYDDGLCPCGRRLKPLPVVRGIGHEIGWMLRIGGRLLVFLLVIGFLLSLADRLPLP